ncbi:hypothetical protein [Actinoalloteichus caeruleus]|uniref:DUF2188 domain-containing protein n=1 Tax=Actinoalloteichus caeruleus DSM 43889 TaxID=1120930 RepID=A0ABT1JN35_ACTCY|nr:hypothetical protein [Actinoalloteichus caeruleus]MCP2333940.1 hypothetical protein [Actinoalloteichus caeruleus DSM 43889]
MELAPITVNYVQDGEDWTVTVVGEESSRTDHASGLLAARARADELIEELSGGHPVAVHLLDGDAVAFTRAYLYARHVAPRDHGDTERKTAAQSGSDTVADQDQQPAAPVGEGESTVSGVTGGTDVSAETSDRPVDAEAGAARTASTDEAGTDEAGTEVPPPATGAVEETTTDVQSPSAPAAGEADQSGEEEDEPDQAASSTGPGFDRSAPAADTSTGGGGTKPTEGEGGATRKKRSRSDSATRRGKRAS